AAPQYLSRRMKLLQANLAGKSQVVLSVDASAIAARAKSAGPIADARLWPFPYEVWKAVVGRNAAPQNIMEDENMFRTNPLLVAGRVRQFKGDVDGEKGAKKIYLNSRPAEHELAKTKLPPELVQRLQASG